MLNNKKIIIDIRTKEEIEARHLLSNSNDTILMFIPVSHIGFNEKMIRDLSKKNIVYIICKKARRSGIVKNKFFSNDKNIISIDGGINKLENDEINKKKLGVNVYHFVSKTKTSIQKQKKNNKYNGCTPAIVIFVIYVITKMV